MIRTFVINLEKSKDRWLSIKTQLDDLWISYERINASNPYQMTKKEIDRIYDEDRAKKVHPPKWLTLGNIWCADSHIRIYKKIIEENIPIALVFEDDAVIDRRILDLINCFNQYTKNKKSTVKRDYLSMNYWFFSIKYLGDHIKKNIKLFLKQGKLLHFLVFTLWWIVYSIIDYLPWLLSKLSKKVLIIKRYRPFYLAWWYFITREWAKKLLSLHDRVFTLADYLPERYRNKSKLKFYITVPVLVEQDRDRFSTTNL